MLKVYFLKKSSWKEREFEKKSIPYFYHFEILKSSHVTLKFSPVVLKITDFLIANVVCMYYIIGSFVSSWVKQNGQYLLLMGQ